jgi:hypothetical protein
MPRKLLDGAIRLTPILIGRSGSGWRRKTG